MEPVSAGPRYLPIQNFQCQKGAPSEVSCTFIKLLHFHSNGVAKVDGFEGVGPFGTQAKRGDGLGAAVGACGKSGERQCSA
jgi:hypothetical protein